jgi:hypothetical protein
MERQVGIKRKKGYKIYEQHVRFIVEGSCCSIQFYAFLSNQEFSHNNKLGSIVKYSFTVISSDSACYR